MSKSEDTKQLILDTAKKEFMEKGYNDASVLRKADGDCHTAFCSNGGFGVF